MMSVSDEALIQFITGIVELPFDVANQWSISCKILSSTTLLPIRYTHRRRRCL